MYEEVGEIMLDEEVGLLSPGRQFPQVGDYWLGPDYRYAGPNLLATAAELESFYRSYPAGAGRITELEVIEGFCVLRVRNGNGVHIIIPFHSEAQAEGNYALPNVGPYFVAQGCWARYTSSQQKLTSTYTIGLLHLVSWSTNRPDFYELSWTDQKELAREALNLLRRSLSQQERRLEKEYHENI